MNKKYWLRRNVTRMAILALMFVPLMMGADCDEDFSSNDVVSIVGIAVDAILAIIFAFA